METTVYEFELNDGRTFRVFCANGAQKRRVVKSRLKIAPILKELRTITNGVHTVTQWEEIIDTL